LNAMPTNLSDPLPTATTSARPEIINISIA
jgi:hypothetical protein